MRRCAEIEHASAKISVADTIRMRRYDNKSFIHRQKQMDMPKPLWGRSDEVNTCIDALKTHRLTTIVGGAGCGKSTVAQAVIATLQDRAKQNNGVYMYRDGICFIDCVPITSYERLCFMIGQTIGLIVTSTKEFGHHIRDSQMLVVLDGKSLTIHHKSWALDFIGKNRGQNIFVWSCLFDDESPKSRGAHAL